MNWNFEKPFTIEEISKYPKAVIIALLIGMLMMFGSVIAVLWYRDNSIDAHCDERIEEKNRQIIQIHQDRIKALEARDYYKQKAETQQQIQDSVVKIKTELYVEKIFDKKYQ
ncbi:hypothetical protein LQ567_16985 [Niabella pedocola]|uniref:Uncharacterized protein n=1 Tax=Niabella pedocola TaxID=1752077 RepID=A0ABS8PW00_9BACT|nr:hypothetical protein [Niabella pedocola]MCD2424478.1 hypothetical protein [Niabella pedocola]